MDYQSVIQIVGGLGVFLYGMKLMSESLQSAAGEKLKVLLDRMTSTRLMAVLSGTAMTATIQSSSATTVMVVGFVNAGLLSLRQAIGTIMGANIGTTLTAWMVALLGFKFKINAFALPAVAIGMVFLFTNRDRAVAWGSTLIGFGLLFLGLGFLKDGVPDLKGNTEALVFLQQYTNMGFYSVLIFVLIGTILTVVVQSSSATSAITITLAVKGYISSDLAAAMILGENIGTTITANLAALAGNLTAKKAALAHTLFNLIGVTWVLTIFPLVMKALPFAVGLISQGDPAKDPTVLGLYISLFHTSFNVTNTLLLVWFVPTIETIVNKVGDALSGLAGKGEKRGFRLLGAGSVRTTGLTLIEAIQYNRESILRALNVFEQVDQLIRDRYRARVAEVIFSEEETLDLHREEMLAFLTEVQESGVHGGQAVLLLATMERARLLEQIGDDFARVARKLRRAHKKDNELGRKHQEQLGGCLDVLKRHVELVRTTVETDTFQEPRNRDYSRELREQTRALLKEVEQKAQKGKTTKSRKEVRSFMLMADIMQILDRLSHDLNHMITAEA